LTDNWHAKGPIVAWANGGSEGWHPRSYPDLKTALLDPERAGYVEVVYTRVIEFDVVEKPAVQPSSDDITSKWPFVSVKEGG